METMERIEDHTHRVTIYSDLQHQRRQCSASDCAMRAAVKGLSAPPKPVEKLLHRSMLGPHRMISTLLDMLVRD